MNRRDILTGAAATTAVVAAANKAQAGPKSVKPLTPPSKGKIPVAVLVSSDARVIDFAGPWEVFQDVHVPARGATMDEQEHESSRWKV